MARDLIYCDFRNKGLSQIAIDAGFKLGVQLPNGWRACNAGLPVYFADQDWKNPDRTVYMGHVARLRPHVATVIDWEREEQFAEVMDWAEAVTQYAERVIIIPKVAGQLHRIPDRINGKEVVLGYSVPTKFGGTPVPIWEFGQRPVHLLGGSPHKQMRLTYYMNVVSADGNMICKIANTLTKYWIPPWTHVDGVRGWVLVEAAFTGNRRIEAFSRSCHNVYEAWKRFP